MFPFILSADNQFPLLSPEKDILYSSSTSANARFVIVIVSLSVVSVGHIKYNFIGVTLIAGAAMTSTVRFTLLFNKSPSLGIGCDSIATRYVP